MADGTRKSASPGRQPARSVMAVTAGLLVNIVLAIAIDELFHLLGVYPPWGEPMFAPGDNALALAYRLPIAVLGAYVTARLAPAAPMRHALILGGIGVALSLLGMSAAARMNLGPLWYPAALVVSALPCAWLGARIAARRT